MEELKNKRIAVFGMGVSGLSALRLLNYLSEYQCELMAINSGEPTSWAKKPGVLDFIPLEKCFAENQSNTADILRDVDLVILSPGIPRDHHLLLPLIKNSIPIWGEIELAYRILEKRNQLKPIIGITGTNGKTTTTTFLGEMIKADHKKVFVGGNIGVPFCDYVFDLLTLNEKAEVDFILLELSSFQLESIDHFHVNLAILLNIYQNHGERYQSIEDYAHSKFFITNRFTKSDVLIYPKDFKIINAWAQTQLGLLLVVDTQQPDRLTFDLSLFKLPGIHNLVNLNFIILAAKHLGLSSRAIQACINEFPGVHHRIEYVDHIKNLGSFKAYNDAKSTNWDATLTAVKAMEDVKAPIYLIIGGKKRGHGDSILPYLDFLKSKVKTFYLIGEMGSEIAEEIKGIVEFKKLGTLEETVKDLRTVCLNNEEGVILFSPGFPSFDQFKNYAHRGEHFMELLRKP